MYKHSYYIFCCLDNWIIIHSYYDVIMMMSYHTCYGFLVFHYPVLFTHSLFLLHEPFCACLIIYIESHFQINDSLSTLFFIFISRNGESLCIMQILLLKELFLEYEFLSDKMCFWGNGVTNNNINNKESAKELCKKGKKK